MCFFIKIKNPIEYVMIMERCNKSNKSLCGCLVSLGYNIQKYCSAEERTEDQACKKEDKIKEEKRG